jgi:hypothetical protein
MVAAAAAAEQQVPVPRVAAARLMGNSPRVWGSHYDEGLPGRLAEQGVQHVRQFKGAVLGKRRRA